MEVVFSEVELPLYGVLGSPHARSRTLRNSCCWCGAVLLVGDVFAPGDGAAGVVGLLHRYVGHEAVRGGAVPVVLSGIEVDAVARADDLDGAAAALAEPHALGDVDGLPKRVGVPGGPSAGGEVDARGPEAGWLRRCRDGVDVDRAGEPLARPGGSFEGVLGDPHGCLQKLA